MRASLSGPSGETTKDDQGIIYEARPSKHQDKKGLMRGKAWRIFLATTDAGKEEGERGCAEEAEVAFTMSNDSEQKPSSKLIT